MALKRSATIYPSFTRLYQSMSRGNPLLWCGLAAALLLSAGLLTSPVALGVEEPTPAAAATETPAPTAETPKEESKAEPAAATEEKKEEEAAAPAPAGDPTPPLTEINYAIDNIVLFLCAVLVIFMQAGFALVETGLNAAKNAVNIMFKNYMDFVIGTLLFFVVGYGVMYPSMFTADSKTVLIPGWLEFGGFGVPNPHPGTAAMPTASAMHPFHPMAFFLFQLAFCATAATIVSGSVAGRIQFKSYLIYTAFITGVVYPISGMWMWGGGWLYTMGFKDFAGSVVVHTVGGMAGLAGAIALGPRIGKFVNGKPMAMPGHNLPFAALGVFILLIGWYGFNPGSQLAFTGAINTDTVSLVAVNTTLAACTGSFMGMVTSWVLFKKPDLTMALNGGLAGLVGITANCNIVTNGSSLVIGAIAGVLVVLAVIALDKVKVDDPVGAFPVHGVCGMWGGIASGLFYDPKLMETAMLAGAGPMSLTTQVIGTLAIGGWSLGLSLGLFFALKALGLLRVHAEEEIAGLDISEHGMYAYPQQLVALESTPGMSGAVPSMGEPLTAGKPSTEAV
ncbi:MAG: ammonium transporter [Pirellulaceae bacterium]|nr:ammonium transporter [Pirellulaceae bacterium]